MAIVVTTYAPEGAIGQTRTEATDRAIASWARMDQGDERVAIIVVDDGSAEDHAWWLRKHIGRLGDWLETPRLGCAGALNAGVRHAIASGADIIFYAQDDWELVEPLDLAPSIALLRQGHADVVRLGPTHPQLVGNVVRTDIPGAEWCLQYDWRGGGYVVGWRPAIYRSDLLVRSLEHVPNGLAAIEGERIWLETVARMRDLPRVFHAPNATLAGPFRHIDTVELGEDAPDTLTERYRNA